MMTAVVGTCLAVTEALSYVSASGWADGSWPDASGPINSSFDYSDPYVDT